MLIIFLRKHGQFATSDQRPATLLSGLEVLEEDRPISKHTSKAQFKVFNYRRDTVDDISLSYLEMPYLEMRV